MAGPFPPDDRPTDQPPQIANAKGGVPTNNSGIIYSHDDRWGRGGPPSFAECDGGLQEQCTQTDQKCVRFFETPFSTYDQFRSWILGYCDSKSIREPSPTEANPPGQLLRLTPDQHPLKPWLYASTCDLVEAQGSAVPDGRQGPLTKIDANNNLVTLKTPAGLPLYAPLAFYAEGNAATGGYSDGLVKVRVEYIPRNYEIRKDSEAHGSKFGELSRFVERDEEATVQALPYHKIAYKGNKDASAYSAYVQQLTLTLLTAATIPGATPASIVAAAKTVPSPDNFLGPTVAFSFAFALLAPNAAGAAARLISGAQTAAAPTIGASNNFMLTFVTPDANNIFAGQPIPEAGVLLMPSSEVVYKWHEVPDRNYTVWDNARGCVNSDVFDGCATGYRTYQPGTLLFLTYKDTRSRNAVGRVQFLVEFRFAFRPSGWNNFPAPDGLYHPATFGGTANGVQVYQAKNFLNLFTMPPVATYQALTG